MPGTGLCECGCGGKTPLAKLTNRKWDHVAGQPVHFMRGHGHVIALDVKFWAKVNKEGPVIRPELGPCWLWTGAQNGSGYGALYLKNSHGNTRGHVASRISWELHHGPIPDGLFACHHCDNPPCVNPAHLFLGTKADNNRDRNQKGRTWNPMMLRRQWTHCSHGHEFTDVNTYWHNNSRHCKECRRETTRRRRKAA